MSRFKRVETKKGIPFEERKRIWQEPVSPESWRDGLTTNQRGYNYRWQKARLAFLNEHPLCASCLLQGRTTPATVVDHIVPHRGDKALFWDSDNWQALCKECHDKKTQEENKI